MRNLTRIHYQTCMRKTSILNENKQISWQTDSHTCRGPFFIDVYIYTFTLTVSSFWVENFLGEICLGKNFWGDNFLGENFLGEIFLGENCFW